MSALGQKRTFAVQRSMSALPPKADIRTGPRYYLRRTSSGSLAIFAAIRRATYFVSSLAADRRPGLILEIDIRQLLPGAVDHDKAGVTVANAQGCGPS